MSEVIVITSGKGGVGKTTTACSLGAGLAGHGKKVLAVDLDAQGNPPYLHFIITVPAFALRRHPAGKGMRSPAWKAVC